MSKRKLISAFALLVLITQLVTQSYFLPTQAAFVGTLSQNKKVSSLENSSTNTTTYRSGRISLVSGCRETTSGGEIPEYVCADKSGGNEVTPEYGEGYEDHHVEALKDGISLTLTLPQENAIPAGNYYIEYIARNGQGDNHGGAHTEDGETFRIGLGGENNNYPDSNDWDNYNFNTQVLEDKTYVFDSPAREITITGTGNGVIEFGAINIVGTSSTPPEPDEENNPPTCTLRAEPNSGTAPLTVQHFYITSSDPDHDRITSFSFNLGDSNTWYGPYAKDPAGDYGSYTYQNAGLYEPRIKLWDEHGAEGSCDTTVNVNQPSYKLTIEKTSSPSDTHFRWNDGTEKGKVFTYTIRYKNESSVALNKVYLFDEFYRTQGNLKDALLDHLKCSAVPNGPADSACKIIDIPRPGQEAFQTIYWDLGTLNPGQSGTVYLRGEVKDLAPNWVEGYLLQNDVYLRDNWEGIESKPNVTADDHVDQWLHINGLPTCNLGVTPQSVTLGQSVGISYSANDDHKVVKYDADLGDGNRVNGTPWTGNLNFDYTYKRAGKYNLTLKVYDDNQASSELCQAPVEVKAPPVVVNNTPPACEIEANPNSGSAPLATQFMMRARDGQDETMQSWSLNTGKDTFNGLGDPPQFKDYTYQKQGKYTAILTVTDHNNTSATCQTNVNVKAPPVVVQSSSTLGIRKLVSQPDYGTYQDANSSASALDLGEVTHETVTLAYKVEVRNTGDTVANNVVVSDVFTRGTHGTNRLEITDVAGATYQNGNFTISSVAAGQTASFTYLAKLSVPAAASSKITDIAYNTARITSFESSAIRQSGVGANDPAYLRLTIPATGETGTTALTIRKAVSQSSVSGFEDANSSATALDLGTLTQETVTLTYKVEVRNSGDTAASNVVISDTFSRGTHGTSRLEINSISGATYQNNNFTITSVAAGQTASFTYQAIVSVPSQGTNEIKDTAYNTARINSFASTAKTQSGVGETDPAYITLTVPAKGTATFTITKQVEKDRMSVSEAEDEEDLQYTITVKNTGTAQGEVRVTDTMTRNEVRGTRGGTFRYNDDVKVSGAVSSSGDLDENNGITLVLASGAEAKLTYTIEMRDLDEIDNDEISEFRNTARLSSGPSADELVKIEGEELEFEIEKTVNGPAVLKSGDIVTYTLKVRNTGDATGTVNVTDTMADHKTSGTYYLPGKSGGRMEYLSGSMKVEGISHSRVDGEITDRDGVELEDFEDGDKVTITYQAIAVLDGVSVGKQSVVDNEACVEFNDEDDCDQAKVTLGSETQSGSFSVSKEVSPVSFTSNGTATYTVTVQNNSGKAASVKVTDTIGNTGYLVGDQGGRLTYQSGSMSVTGASSFEGDIGSSQGLSLLLNAGASATIRYTVTVDLSSVAAGHSSQVTNLVLLSTGESDRTTVTLTRSSGGYAPPTHYIRPPGTFTKTGGAMLPAGLATTLGGLLSYIIRRKRLGL